MQLLRGSNETESLKVNGTIDSIECMTIMHSYRLQDEGLTTTGHMNLMSSGSGGVEKLRNAKIRPLS